MKSVSTNVTTVITFVREDGETFWAESRVNNSGDRSGWTLTHRSGPGTSHSVGYIGQYPTAWDARVAAQRHDHDRYEAAIAAGDLSLYEEEYR